MIARVLFAVALVSTIPAADLQLARAEPSLEKRSEKALVNANRALDEARDAYHAGDSQKTQTALQEVAESVKLSYESLSDTGKHPRSSPKYFKRAELGVRELLRRLKSIESDFAVEDRPSVVQTVLQLQQVHDDLMAGLMSKKKK